MDKLHVVLGNAFFHLGKHFSQALRGGFVSLVLKEVFNGIEPPQPGAHLFGARMVSSQGLGDLAQIELPSGRNNALVGPFLINLGFGQHVPVDEPLFHKGAGEMRKGLVHADIAVPAGHCAVDGQIFWVHLEQIMIAHELFSHMLECVQGLFLFELVDEYHIRKIEHVDLFQL